MPTTSGDTDIVSQFFATAFSQAAGHGLLIGTSMFPPKGGEHAWHANAEAAAEWCTRRQGANVYFRTTLVARRPGTGRGSAADAAAMIGVHADIDIADPVHRKKDLAPDIETAQRVITVIGLSPTLVVHTGHGLQAHWFFERLWRFEDEADWQRGQALAKGFGGHVERCAKRLGVAVDNVSDLARLMRVPGTLNAKSEPVAVRLLLDDGPRHSIDAIREACTPRAPRPASSSASSSRHPTSDDDAVLARARRQRGFVALFERGDLSRVQGDASRGDWRLCRMLADACSGDADCIDRLFRRSALMRPKWDERHAADGRTYGAMTIADVREHAQSSVRTANQDGAELPVVIVSGRQLREVSHEVVQAIRAAQVAPTIFEWSGGLAQVSLDRGREQCHIEPLTIDAIIGIMSRAADFVRVTKDGDEVACLPPGGVARDILSNVRSAFPVLRGLVTCPRMRPDGTVLSAPGYDPATGLYLAQYPGWEQFEVSSRPGEGEVASARGLLFDLLSDFPFMSGADRANALAFLLTPITRPAIEGCVPMAAFDALSKQGTGKSLLAKTLMAVATGRVPAMMPLANDESERRKAIFATLVEGADVVLFDNATEDLIESGVLANALTAEVFTDRVLGVSKRAAAPVRCTWGITGNALAFGRDLLRRIYIVMLDAGVEQPELRTGFRHDLPRHAIENHISYLRAALILARNWWARGCPRAEVPPLGSFESWATVVGGILEAAGIDGFLSNRAQYREAVDDERAEWRAFVEAIAKGLPPGRPFTVSALVEAMGNSSRLVEALPLVLREAWDANQNFAVKLGRALHKRGDAAFGGLRFSKTTREPHTRRPQYVIEAARAVTPAGEKEAAGVAGVCGGLASDPEVDLQHDTRRTHS